MGEYNISSVAAKAYKEWVARNEDMNLAVQYSEETVTFNIVRNPHNATAYHIVSYIIREVEGLNGAETDLSSYTGRTVSPLS